jgi:hypothetical protein
MNSLINLARHSVHQVSRHSDESRNPEALTIFSDIALIDIVTPLDSDFRRNDSI